MTDPEPAEWPTLTILLPVYREPSVIADLAAANRAVLSTVARVPRADDRWVISGIIFVIRNGLRWRDALKDYGPHKTICNRFVRWSRLGVFNKIFSALVAAEGGKPDRLMITALVL